MGTTRDVSCGVSVTFVYNNNNNNDNNETMSYTSKRSTIYITAWYTL